MRSARSVPRSVAMLACLLAAALASGCSSSNVSASCQPCTSDGDCLRGGEACHGQVCVPSGFEASRCARESSASAGATGGSSATGSSGSGAASSSGSSTGSTTSASTTGTTGSTGASGSSSSSSSGGSTGATSCLVNGVTYDAGDVDPSNVCQLCDPARSTTLFSPATDGRGCGGAGSGTICVDSACVPGCAIAGVGYAVDGGMPSNPCVVCQPWVVADGWTEANEGVPCGAGQVCTAGSCLPCATPSLSPPAPMPDSETATCSNGTSLGACGNSTYPSQDGDQVLPAPSYQVGAGFLTDRVTGLTWEAPPTTNASVTWPEAVEACDTMSLGGHDDWRLPTLSELVGLADLGRSGNKLDPGFNASGNIYWASTRYAGDNTEAWAWNASEGTDDVYPVSQLHHVWCVRSDACPAPASFTDRGATVLDGRTGLLWQKGTAGYLATWVGALDYCASLSLGGYPTGWRVPNAKELSTIADYGQVNPGAASIFGMGATELDWSSSPVASSPGSSYAVHFDDGNIDVRSTSASESVRCVRGP